MRAATKELTKLRFLENKLKDEATNATVFFIQSISETCLKAMTAGLLYTIFEL